MFDLEASSLKPSQNNKMVTTNNKFYRLVDPILITFKTPILFVFTRGLLIPFSIIRNNRGGMGHPCCNPLLGLNLVLEPLTNAIKETM